MSGISVKLPLQVSPKDGPYLLNRTYQESVQQNLKMLLFTVPGERVMDILFGVGIRNYLFEMNTDVTFNILTDAIHDQVQKYMPFIEIEDIVYSNRE